MIGGLLLFPEQLAEVRVIVDPTDLYKLSNRTIYEAMLRIEGDFGTRIAGLTPEQVDKGDEDPAYREYLKGASDWILVYNEVVRAGQEPNAPKDYFAELLQDTPNGMRAIDHARAVKRAAQMRRLWKVCAQTIGTLRECQELSDAEIANLYQTLMRRLMDAADLEGLRTFHELLLGFDFNHEALNHDPDYPRTGIQDIDEDADLFVKKELTVIAARPRMGKTSWMRQLARLIARTAHVAAFTMEESSEMMRDKMLCTEARLPYQALRRHGKYLDEARRSRIILAQGTLAEIHLDLSDATLDAAQVAAQVRKLGALGRPPRVVFIDHLQHMRHERDRGENDAAMYARAVFMLKEVAKQNDCSVVLLCQLNRGVEGRDPPRPILADLRDSGAIEQHAANVVFIWHENPDQDERYIYVCKQRHGPPLEVKTVFLRDQGLFGALAERTE